MRGPIKYSKWLMPDCHEALMLVPGEPIDKDPFYIGLKQFRESGYKPGRQEIDFSECPLALRYPYAPKAPALSRLVELSMDRSCTQSEPPLARSGRSA